VAQEVAFYWVQGAVSSCREDKISLLALHASSVRPLKKYSLDSCAKRPQVYTNHAESSQLQFTSKLERDSKNTVLNRR